MFILAPIVATFLYGHMLSIEHLAVIGKRKIGFRQGGSSAEITNSFAFMISLRSL